MPDIAFMYVLHVSMVCMHGMYGMYVWYVWCVCMSCNVWYVCMVCKGQATIYPTHPPTTYGSYSQCGGQVGGLPAGLSWMLF